MAEDVMQDNLEQLGVQHLAQGYFDMEPGELGIRISDLLVTG